ncbi:hypothetical protein Bca52824_037507 [Brassica carinata]|uniref:tyrosine--tRNA ligase n=1 Tax=Brassica carinata TaxID=52824 RepID=A0A8X7RPF8_BRACI|nr:hypothetical protein Bca52824_037507 [Brassica carinata]
MAKRARTCETTGERLRGPVRVPRSIGLTNRGLAYGFDLYYNDDPPTLLVPCTWSKNYGIGLYGRIGLQCYNLQKGTNLKFKRLEKHSTKDTSFFSLYITLEATDPATGSVCSFQTQFGDAGRRISLGARITWLTLASTIKQIYNQPIDDVWDEDTPRINEFYKVPMPKWFSDEARERDSKKYYVVPESELHDNDWLQLLMEVAFFSKADRCLDAYLPLELKNVVVETFEDYTTEPSEKLKADNAIFYISYKCCSDPSTPLAGDHRDVVRKTMDGKPGHMCLEINARGDEYWPFVMDNACRNSLAKIKRCMPIMGHSETDELSAAHVLYVCMQCADPLFLEADICQLGMDQQTVNLLARDYCDEAERGNKPVILSHHMLPTKMSKNDPSSAIFMDDDEGEVNRKIKKKAYCPPKIVEGNPCLEYVKYIILPWFNEFTVERDEKHGGNKTFDNFEDIATDYESDKLHPMDLKNALSKALNNILQPVHDHFKTNNRAKNLLKQDQKTNRVVATELYKEMEALSVNAPSSAAGLQMSEEAERKYNIARSIGEECIQEDELKNMLAKKPTPICYDGFEPSGRMHIAQFLVLIGVMKVTNVKLTSAGCQWIADWFAQLNNKLGGDLEKIKVIGEYFKEIWQAGGMNPEKVEFLWASEEISSRGNKYWPACDGYCSQKQRTCGQIMGRSETEVLSAAQILYPCMQCADIFFLGADICQLGMDQRKVNMLAREYCDDIKRKNKPIILSHHMLHGLLEGQEKMSKSNPSSAIFMEDEDDAVNEKISQAHCPLKTVVGNPCLEYIKYLVLLRFNEFVVEQNGGNKTFTSFEDIAAEYESGELRERLRGPVRVPRSIGLTNRGLAYGFDLYYNDDPPTLLVPCTWSKNYGIGLYGRIGLQCYNLQKGTNLKFKRLEKHSTKDTSFFSLYITLEATDPATGSVCSFQTQFGDAGRRISLGARITWLTLASTIKQIYNQPIDDVWDEDTPRINEFYKVPMPKWFSDEARERDSKKYYVCLDAYLPLELKNVVVETFEDYTTEPSEKLKADNAIFYISYKCCSDPSTPLAGDHRDVVRKTMDGKPGHMCLELDSINPFFLPFNFFHVKAIDIPTGDEYWPFVMDNACRNSLAKIKRCMPIMGHSETDELSAAHVLYVCMQCADPLFLEADICQLGMDQQTVNLLARDYCDEAERGNKPVILSHHMLPTKMSKNDPSSAIFMDDDEGEVNRKIKKKAYCPPKIVEGNPCLEYVKYIILPWFNEFTVERDEKHGGNKTFDNFEDIATDYESDKLHPMDLKNALSKALNNILQPVHDHFKTNNRAKNLLKQDQKTNRVVATELYKEMEALSVNAPSSAAGLQMSEEAERKYNIARSIGEECIQEDELKNMLAKKPTPICYDGFEPSGRMHIAQGVMKVTNVKLTSAGCQWIADWFAQLNNKLGGDLEKIKVIGEYFKEIWQAGGMNPEKCGQIMGRSETEVLSAAQILYPCMQCADIFFLGYVFLHAFLICFMVFLKDKRRCQSNPSSAIFMEDEDDAVNEKISQAHCPLKTVVGNPCLEYIKYLVLLRFNEFVVEQNGGNKTFTSFEDIAAEYESGELSEEDLKKPVRDHFKTNERAKNLPEQVRAFRVTR